jgi:hypothetical protein
MGLKQKGLIKLEKAIDNAVNNSKGGYNPNAIKQSLFDFCFQFCEDITSFSGKNKNEDEFVDEKPIEVSIEGRETILFTFKGVSDKKVAVGLKYEDDDETFFYEPLPEYFPNVFDLIDCLLMYASHIDKESARIEGIVLAYMNTTSEINSVQDECIYFTSFDNFSKNEKELDAGLQRTVYIPLAVSSIVHGVSQEDYIAEAYHRLSKENFQNSEIKKHKP